MCTVCSFPCINLEKASRYFGDLTSVLILQGRPIKVLLELLDSIHVEICHWSEIDQWTAEPEVHQNPGYPLQLLSKSVLGNDL